MIHKSILMFHDVIISTAPMYRRFAPTGKSVAQVKTCPSLLTKKSACAVGQIRGTESGRPAPERGAYAQSPRTLGAGCNGRVGVARRAMRMRTAKSCGPDTPTL